MGMIVSFAIKSWIEAGVITAVVVMNIAVGFSQEYSAEKTMDSLRSLSSPTATVIRSRILKTIRSLDLVPGDIVEVKMGDTIPADMRLFEAMNKSYRQKLGKFSPGWKLRLTESAHFETDEALLTGESVPVAKNVNALFKQGDEVGVGDRINMTHASSTVSKGRAKAIVVSTGMKTEIGLIAQLLRKSGREVHSVRCGEDGYASWYQYIAVYSMVIWSQAAQFLGVSVGTPLQRKLSWLAIILFVIAVVFALICLAANNFNNSPEVILYAVA